MTGVISRSGSSLRKKLVDSQYRDVYDSRMSKRKKKATKMGRRPMAEGKAKSIQLTFRVKPALCEKIGKAAKRDGKTLAAWVRDILTEILEDE